MLTAFYLFCIDRHEIRVIEERVRDGGREGVMTVGGVTVPGLVTVSACRTRGKERHALYQH